MMRTFVLLLAFFASFGAKAQNASCPQPVVCNSNPCNGTRCVRFLNSECRVDACHGECRATFFRLSNRREVTNRCAAPTCAQTQCPARRMCVDRIVPSTCPGNRPNCRQYISPQCVLPPPPQPPTNCAVILCPSDRPVCEVRQTRQGPRARCQPQPPPTSCENVECDEGMECRLRERDGLDPVVRCKPIRVTPTPTDCSQLECSDEFVCMVTNGTAICVEPPPLPDICEGLDCEERDLECRILNITILNITRAICAPISDCSRIRCNESLGLECRVRKGPSPVAFCAPTANCSRISCNESQGLECRVREGPSPIAFCARTANCSRIRCNESLGLECRVREGPSPIAFCAPTANCSRISCNESQGLECRVIGEGQFRFAFCSRTANCSRIRCNEREGLECRVVGEGDFSVAVCQLTRNCSILNPVCRRSGLVCEEPTEGDLAFRPASCVAATSCEDLECNPGMVCREFTINNGASGGGLGSGSGSPQTVASCGPVLSQSSCDDLVCVEDQVCILTVYPSRNISLATCTLRSLVQAVQSQSCSDTGLEMCSQSGQLCVDLVQGGDQVTFSCVQTNCIEGGREGSGSGSTSMCTEPGTSCVSVPGQLSERGIQFDSVCLQTAIQFEFETACENRMCPEGLACQAIEIDGAEVGTICNIPATTVRTCDSVECADETECVQFETAGVPYLSLCLLSVTLDTILQSLVNP